MIAWAMETFDCIVPGKKSVGLHVEFLIHDLHHEGGAEIDDVGITNIGELCIGEAFWMLLPQMIKSCFPEEVDKGTQGSRWRYPVVIVFKMIGMEEFDVLHW